MLVERGLVRSTAAIEYQVTYVPHATEACLPASPSSNEVLESLCIPGGCSSEKELIFAAVGL